MAPDRHVSERRRFVKLLGIGTGVSAGLPVATAAESHASDESQLTDSEDDGLITVPRETDFETTRSDIEAAIDARDLVLLETIDHAANAAEVGLALPPTTLLLFGNPAVGTPLMQDARSVAIDLPQKLLIWEEDGDVFVTYTDPQWLAARHGLEANATLERIDGIATTLEELATAQS